MDSQDWLTDTRTSYDTVAADYAVQLRHALDEALYLRAALDLFATQVTAAGGGPVADIGCGPGHVTAYLDKQGVEAFGIDLSPAMIDTARRDHPSLRFEVGSMTDLRLPDTSLAGLLACWSLIHIPDRELATVFGHFARVTRPGAPLLLGFHLGEETHLKTRGYGGHPMKVRIHRRRPEQLTDRLSAAGFTVTAQLLLDLDTDGPGAVMFARRRPPAA